MKTGDYRRDYAAYSAALERARYEHHTGIEPRLRLSPLRDRYADLWTRDAASDLARAREDIPRQFETERAALATLLSAAESGYAETCAAEVTAELLRCEASARVEWEGARLALDEAPAVIASETDSARRRELAARWLDALGQCSDLRAARFDALREGARSLGHDSYFTLASGITEAGVESLDAGARVFLERTAPIYAAKLFEWSARHLPAPSVRAPAYADSLFFARLMHLDKFFPASELRATYEATMAGLGIRVSRQANVRIETTAAGRVAACAACFALKPPEDVRFVYRNEGGASYYRKFLETAGRAQHFAWASHELAERYPEFVYTPDDTTRAGFAFLFGDLLTDASWLAAHRNVRPSEASEIARACALVELYRTRLACVRLQQQRALEAATDTRSEYLAEAYAASLSETTNFAAHPSLFLRDLIPVGLHEEGGECASSPSPAVYLRARLFAVALGEYFRTRHGHRWWSSNRAADELIDMWNTASRYTVEELASLVGFGALSFDLLADAFNSILTRE
ncbi:MAG TPA: hypothetical protein VGW12_06455 [Pyrinomonadaceae bacterium]|nr:hypothetical protein [Pyrinomonadaceae bacterium]